MKILILSIISILLIGCSSKNIENSKNYNLLVKNGKIDSVFNANNIQYIDSSGFENILKSKNKLVITHTMNPTCGTTHNYAKTIGELRKSSKYNNIVLPFCMIDSSIDFGLNEINIMKQNGLNQFFFKNGTFNYFQILKNRYKEEGTFFIFYDGKFISALDEVNAAILKNKIDGIQKSN